MNEVWVYCGLADEQLATSTTRDEAGASAYCKGRISQACFYDCKHVVTLIPRTGMKIEIVPVDDMEIRGNPNTNFLGC